MLELLVVSACVAGFVWVCVRVSREWFGHSEVRAMARLGESGRLAEERQAELPRGRDRGMGLCVQATAAFGEGDSDAALALLDEAIAFGDSPRGILEVASQLKASLLTFLGRYDDAIAVAFPFSTSPWAAHLRGQIAVERGETQLAETLLAQELQLYADDAIRLRELARLRLNQGALKEADKLLSQAVAYLSRPRERPVTALVSVFLLRAEVTLTGDAPELARRHLDSALAEARQIPPDDRPARLSFLAVAASLAARLGDTATAEQLLERAEEPATRLSSPPLEAALSAARGDLAVAMGREEQGAAELARAIELYERLGGHAKAALLRARLDSRS